MGREDVLEEEASCLLPNKSEPQSPLQLHRRKIESESKIRAITRETLTPKRQNLINKSCVNTCTFNLLHFYIKMPEPSAVAP